MNATFLANVVSGQGGAQKLTTLISLDKGGTWKEIQNPNASCKKVRICYHTNFVGTPEHLCLGGKKVTESFFGCIPPHRSHYGP